MATNHKKTTSKCDTAAVCAAGRSPSIQHPASSIQRRRPRRGISLLEVLIAMFVMLFGLMGVAAIFPVGSHYAAKGDQYDRGAALAGSAFAELKSRGLMRPGSWLYADSTTTNNLSVMTNGYFRVPIPTTNAPHPGHAFVIDAVGSAQTITAEPGGNFFPFNAELGANPWTTLLGQGWPIRRVTFPVPDPANPGSLIRMDDRVAAAIFRLHDDVSVSQPDESDRPGIQRWAVDTNGTPDFAADDTRLARDYTGNYSWLATVVPTTADANPTTPDALQGMQPGDPNYGNYLYEVSVAVFYKRDGAATAAGERVLEAELGPGGSLEVLGLDVATVDDASQDINPGQWIALAGVHPTSGKFLLRWYRLLSYDDETTEGDAHDPTEIHRDAMIEGPEWPAPLNGSGQPIYPIANLRAILLPNIIGVATQTIKLETD